MSRSELSSASHGVDASRIVEFPATGDLHRIGALLARTFPDVVASKRRMRKVESIECVRLKRETARQNLRLLISTRSCFVGSPYGALRPAVCCMSAGMDTSSCRSQGTRATVCRGDRIGWSRSFSRRRRSGRNRLRLHSKVPPQCWTPSACSRAARSTGVS